MQRASPAGIVSYPVFTFGITGYEGEAMHRDNLNLVGYPAHPSIVSFYLQNIYYLYFK